MNAEAFPSQLFLLDNVLFMSWHPKCSLIKLNNNKHVIMRVKLISVIRACRLKFLAAFLYFIGISNVLAASTHYESEKNQIGEMINFCFFGKEAQPNHFKPNFNLHIVYDWINEINDHSVPSERIQEVVAIGGWFYFFKDPNAAKFRKKIGDNWANSLDNINNTYRKDYSKYENEIYNPLNSGKLKKIISELYPNSLRYFLCYNLEIKKEKLVFNNMLPKLVNAQKLAQRDWNHFVNHLIRAANFVVAAEAR